MVYNGPFFDPFLCRFTVSWSGCIFVLFVWNDRTHFEVQNPRHLQPRPTTASSAFCVLSIEKCLPIRTTMGCSSSPMIRLCGRRNYFFEVLVLLPALPKMVIIGRGREPVHVWYRIRWNTVAIFSKSTLAYSHLLCTLCTLWGWMTGGSCSPGMTFWSFPSRQVGDASCASVLVTRYYNTNWCEPLTNRI